MKKQNYPFTLMPLPYDYDALEPYIDKETMHYHHDKHHQAYVDNLNKALANHPEFHHLTLEELLSNLEKLPAEIQTAVRNNGGGVYNHNLFWLAMTPQPLGKPIGKLAEAINERFGSYEEFKNEFKKAALSRFGSGWAWLVSDKNNRVDIISTPTQNTPLEQGLRPLLPLDVWEHAYYLKYQNRRGDYIDNWFNIVDWQQAEKLFAKE
ncbi:MAG: superoxide dismutase [Bacillota bacterium]|nr:superoxide dismutase [Bacillota bacterium]